MYTEHSSWRHWRLIPSSVKQCNQPSNDVRTQQNLAEHLARGAEVFETLLQPFNFCSYCYPRIIGNQIRTMDNFCWTEQCQLSTDHNSIVSIRCRKIQMAMHLFHPTSWKPTVFLYGLGLCASYNTKSGVHTCLTKPTNDHTWLSCMYWRPTESSV